MKTNVYCSCTFLCDIRSCNAPLFAVSPTGRVILSPRWPSFLTSTSLETSNITLASTRTAATATATKMPMILFLNTRVSATQQRGVRGGRITLPGTGTKVLKSMMLRILALMMTQCLAEDIHTGLTTSQPSSFY